MALEQTGAIFHARPSFTPKTCFVQVFCGFHPDISRTIPQYPARLKCHNSMTGYTVAKKHRALSIGGEQLYAQATTLIKNAILQISTTFPRLCSQAPESSPDASDKKTRFLRLTTHIFPYNPMNSHAMMLL